MKNIDAIDEFIKNNKPRFKKWEKHLKDFNWSTEIKLLFIEEENSHKIGKSQDYELEFYSKTNEFKVQVGLVKKILDRLKFFIDKTKGDYRNPKFKSFFKMSTDIISIHIKRCDKYSLEVDETDIKIHDLRSKEAEFNSSVFSEYSKVEGILASYGYVEEEEKDSDFIEFYDNKKASLAVYQEVYRDYPSVKKKMDSMKIDFNSPPPKELHIYVDKPPIWDAEKHFWEQEKKTIQYFVDELKKIEEGVEIDGLYFDGWLYYHINHFRAQFPIKKVFNGIEESRDMIAPPPLRDNEWMISEYFNKTKREQGYALIAATRRAAKTTLNASRIERAKVLGRRQILVAGGSATDLGQIIDNCKINIDNCEPAFALYILGTDDKGGEEFGIRSKDNKRKRHTTVYVKNLDGGTNKKKVESLAGFTPDEFILDEAFKFPFAGQLSGLEPALFGVGIMRAIPIISGTGGDDDLAVDGIKMLNHPEDNKVVLMDWADLNRGVPEELRTWKERPFGLFLPAQMSIRYGDKIIMDLATYLNLDKETHPMLAKINIGVTDWKNTIARVNIDRDKLVADKKKYVKLLAYHPIDPSEIFLSGKVNPFPVAEAKNHRKYLEESGEWDRRRDLFRDSKGEIQMELSKKELLPYPYKGISDAPFLIFEDPPKGKVPYGTYTAGFDDYKQEDSDTDSVATFYVWKNEILGDKFSKKIVASLSIRPERHRMVHEKWLLLMEAYQLDRTAFGENEDFKIKDFLDLKQLTEQYLAPSLDFMASFTIANNQKRKFGWTPNTAKRFLFNLFVDYCNEPFQIETEDGNIIDVKGVQRIDDIYLLDEIISYSENANVDRIIAAMGGYGYIHYLISSCNWSPTRMAKFKQQQSAEERKPFVRTTYSKSRSDSYGKRGIN